MSHPQSEADSDPEQSAFDARHHAFTPADEQHDLAFRSIKAIDPHALEPSGAVSPTASLRTPRGIRPMIWVKFTDTRAAIVFEVTLHSGQCIEAYIPVESWRLGNCDSEAVRAAIQMAYYNLICEKPGSSIVRPGTVCFPTLPRHTSLRDRLKEWGKRRLPKKSKKYGASHRKERMGGDVGGREEGNRSGSGSGSGELTYSESRSSASSYTSDNSASERANKPSTVTRPATQGASAKPSLTGDLKSFSCTLCTATFTRKGDCLRHRRIVHARETPHDCQGCGERFFGSGMRREHWKAKVKCESAHWREVSRVVVSERLVDGYI